MYFMGNSNLNPGSNIKTSVIGYEATIGKALFLAAAYIVVGIVLPAILDVSIWRNFGNKISPWLNLATLIIISSLFFISLIKNTKSKIIIFNKITIIGVLFAILCSVLFYLLLDNFLDPIFDSMFPASAKQYQEMLISLRQIPLATFFRVCLFAPITEEILMRGFMLSGLQSKYNTATALLVTTIVFAVFHFNFVQSISAGICGLVLGLLYINTGSLFCCILAHALYNTISYVTVVL